MSVFTFDELVDAAQHLQPEMQNVLVHMIRVAPPASTPDEALSVWEALREAGAFEATSALCHANGKVVVTPCEADLWAASQNMATVWEDDPSL